MTLIDVLCEIVERADAPDDEADHFLDDDLAEYPEEHIAGLMTLGLLRPGAPARTIVCPACYDEHWEEPESMPGAAPRWFIRCPQFGPQEIDPESLRRHRLDFDALSHYLARFLDPDGSAQEMMANRLWRVGALASGTEIQDVYFFRGARWMNSHQLLDALGEQSTILTIGVVSKREGISGFHFVPLRSALRPALQGGVRLLTGPLKSPVSGRHVLDDHAFADGRPSIPGGIWASFSPPEQLIIELYANSSEEISRRLKVNGPSWQSGTVDSVRSKLRARLKRLGLGGALPDARPGGSGRRPRIGRHSE